jgi:DNA-binding transcriptional MerR regulator
MRIEDLQKKDYFTIGDAAKISGVPEYSIRYWEKAFGLIKPIRKESRHRRYNKEDLNTILKIKELIYKHKLTLEGAKKQLSRYMAIGAKPKEAAVQRTVRDIRLLKETLLQII